MVYLHLLWFNKCLEDRLPFHWDTLWEHLTFPFDFSGTTSFEASVTTLFHFPYFGGGFCWYCFKASARTIAKEICLPTSKDCAYLLLYSKEGVSCLHMDIVKDRYSHRDFRDVQRLQFLIFNKGTKSIQQFPPVNWTLKIQKVQKGPTLATFGQKIF